jgi:hypothetical protein
MLGRLALSAHGDTTYTTTGTLAGYDLSTDNVPIPVSSREIIDA